MFRVQFLRRPSEAVTEQRLLRERQFNHLERAMLMAQHSRRKIEHPFLAVGDQKGAHVADPANVKSLGGEINLAGNSHRAAVPAQPMRQALHGAVKRRYRIQHLIGPIGASAASFHARAHRMQPLVPISPEYIETVAIEHIVLIGAHVMPELERQRGLLSI